MAQQRIVHGAVVDFLTPDEMYAMIPRPSQMTRVRNTAQVTLNATGAGVVEAYEVTVGYEFAVRRVTLYLAGNADPFAGAVSLGPPAAGKGVAYQRSGAFIEWAQPTAGGVVQVPGVQTWGDQQGPYLRNGEVFECAAIGLTANVLLTAVVEGLLHRPSTERQNGA